MSDKLTDNEIIKALECRIDCNCKECPCYKNIEGEMRCTEIDEEEIIDLINRLQAENEKLAKDWSDVTIEKDELFDIAEKQKAEIERLSGAIYQGTLSTETQWMAERCYQQMQVERVERAKSEAIKEFEDKIKDKFDKHGVDYTAYVIVDDVSKEMVGDK